MIGAWWRRGMKMAIGYPAQGKEQRMPPAWLALGACHSRGRRGGTPEL
jgi:hypothetical protein